MKQLSPEEFLQEGFRLMAETLQTLFQAGDLDLEAWRTLRESSAPMTENDLPGEHGNSLMHRALLRLAEALTADDVAQAELLTADIPKIPDFDLPSRLATAHLHRQRAYMSKSPKEIFTYASDLYQLVFFVPTDQRLSAVRIAAEVIEIAIGGFLQTEDPNGALGPAILWTSLVNEHDLQDTLPKALALGSYLLFDVPQEGRAPGPALMLANNLVNTCQILGSRHTDQAEHFCLETIRHARFILENIELTSGSEPRALWISVHERGVRGLAFSYLNLVQIGQGDIEDFVTSAWSWIQEYLELGGRYRDPDLQLRAESIRDQALIVLRTSHPELASRLPMAEEPARLRAVRALEEMPDRISRRREEAQKLLKDLASSPMEAERLLESTFRAWYTDMERCLKAMLGEVGLNFRCCRFLLALGAMSQGVILPSLLIERWALGLRTGSGASNHQTSIHERQEVFPITSMKEVVDLVAALHGLATVTEALQMDPSFQRSHQRLVRERNAELLREVLPALGAHVLTRRSLDRENDLLTLFRGFSQPAIEAGLHGYQERVGAASAEPEG